MIPAFPEFKPVGIEDRETIESFIRSFPSEACEINFTNIFIWRRFERSRWTLINGNLCLLCEPPDEEPYFLAPIGKADLEKTVRTCLDVAPRLSRVPGDFVTNIGQGLKSEPDRDNFDYVFRSEDLIRLQGKKYDGKRNRIRKFERTHSHLYLRLVPELIDGCRRLFDEWLDLKAKGKPVMPAEKDAIMETLNHFEALSLSGGAIDVDGRIRAFSIGERLTDDTAVIHVEIADPQRPGLAQLINREFVRNEWTGMTFINREQDAGIPGLRKAKLSYHPHHFVEKYDVRKMI